MTVATTPISCAQSIQFVPLSGGTYHGGAARNRTAAIFPKATADRRHRDELLPACHSPVRFEPACLGAVDQRRQSSHFAFVAFKSGSVYLPCQRQVFLVQRDFFGTRFVPVVKATQRMPLRLVPHASEQL